MATAKSARKTTAGFPKIQVFTSESDNKTVDGKKSNGKDIGKAAKKKPLSENDYSKTRAAPPTKKGKDGEKSTKLTGKAGKGKKESHSIDVVCEKENRPPSTREEEENKKKGSRKGALELPKIDGNSAVGEKSPAKVKSGRANLQVRTGENAGATLAQDPGEKKRSSRGTPSPTAINRNFQTERDVAILESIFPNIDPTFLKAQYVKMKRSVDDTVNLISVKKADDETPQRGTHLRKSDVEKIQSKYTVNFNVDEYLKAIPDPWNYFLNTELHNCIRYADLSLKYLKKKFPRHYVHTIQEILISCEYSLYRANKELSNKKKNHLFKKRMSGRVKSENGDSEPTHIDFQFLQEVAFIEHEEEIMERLRKLEMEKFRKFKNVLKFGGLLRCQGCANSNLAWENMICCSDNHVICRDCINQHVKTEIVNGNFDFKCPLLCQEKLSLSVMQDVLKPEIAAIIVRKHQLDELKLAGFTDFAHCPACYYTKLMPSEEQKLFYCLNPSCMKVSCRKCKRDEHEPYECKDVREVETFEIKLEPIPLVCFLCNKDFVKENDSNRLVCPCGNVMCYTCRQPFADCPHLKMRQQNEESKSVGRDRDHDEPDEDDDTDFQDFIDEEQDDDDAEANSKEANPGNDCPSSENTLFQQGGQIFPDFVSSDSDVY